MHFNYYEKLSLKNLRVYIGKIKVGLRSPCRRTPYTRNSRKYELGSLRKTPTEGNPPIGLGPSSDNWP